jgi:hypothetical protein
MALPAYLVVAWACGRAWTAGGALRLAGVVVCVLAAAPLTAQMLTERYHPDLQFRGSRYSADVDKCAVVKSASAYVREQAVAGATVFHLSDYLPLGLAGEFYYGLSYLGSNQTGERNRIIDFGTQIVGRRHTPEQWARAYGVPHFTYYVEFLPTDSFAADAVTRLQQRGARVAVDIRDGERVIGRVWQFDVPAAQVMDVREAAARWNGSGSLRRLFQQSLAGTGYHFGPAWPPVPE